MRSIRVIFYVLLSTRMCSVRAGTSVDHFTEDKLVNRAFQMQPLNFADLDKTTLGKPQKPNSAQDSSEKLVKKAMTKETRAYIILAAVAACMGFLLIWWKAMQKVTKNGNLSLPRWSSAEAGLNESLLASQGETIRCDPLQPAVDQPAPKTSVSAYAEQRQEYKQPVVEQHAAAIDKTSASVDTERSEQNEHEQPTIGQQLAAIEGYSAEEIMKLWQWKKIIAGERLPSITRPCESKTLESAVSGSKVGPKSISKSPQARYGQRASPFKHMSTTQSVMQTKAVTRASSVDTYRNAVRTPSVPFGSSRVMSTSPSVNSRTGSIQRTLPRVIR